MTIEPISSWDEVISLLTACDLPTADIPAAAPFFFGLRLDGKLVAVVGLEAHPPSGLLRSLAVSPAFRRRGFASKLLACVEDFAGTRGIETLFLLTTSAAAFFRQHGYAPTARQTAPAAIQATAQFSGLCPSASAFLSKQIAPAPGIAAGNPLASGI